MSDSAPTAPEEAPAGQLRASSSPPPRQATCSAAGCAGTSILQTTLLYGAMLPGETVLCVLRNQLRLITGGAGMVVREEAKEKVRVMLSLNCHYIVAT